MLTYQIRPRVFRLKDGEQLQFPNQCVIRFHFQPAQPFGVEAGGGRTAIRAVAAQVTFNANSGEHTVESKEPLSPLDVTIKEASRTLRLEGTALSIVDRFQSLEEMHEMIQSVYFVLPTILNVPFADPPYVVRVDGNVGTVGFRWELAKWRIDVKTTTQEKQEESFAGAWERMGVLSVSHRRRLVAGLHYFHVACRLARAGCTAGEFAAEVLLNLAKSLEVLFPPTGDGRTRDAARDGLRALGFSGTEIEADFIPAMALRNEIDIGHVGLALLKPRQLKTIHEFSEQAEIAFRGMFERMLAMVESGEADVAPHTAGPAQAEVAKLIERLREALAAREAARSDGTQQ